MRTEIKTIGFVRALVGGAVATGDCTSFRLPDGRAIAAGIVDDLAARGVLSRGVTTCRAAEHARTWLTRTRFDAGAVPVQAAPRDPESPLTRLAGVAGFLSGHHVAAGERLRVLFERAHLQPRLTSVYSPAHVAGRSSQAGADMSDMAAEARKTLAGLYGRMPRESLDIAIDVCGLLKGLQDVERDYDLPRRSGKLVLRLALEQLAMIWGLSPVATGPTAGSQRGWIAEDGRPTRFE